MVVSKISTFVVALAVLLAVIRGVWPRNLLTRGGSRTLRGACVASGRAAHFRLFHPFRLRSSTPSRRSTFASDSRPHSRGHLQSQRGKELGEDRTMGCGGKHLQPRASCPVADRIEDAAGIAPLLFVSIPLATALFRWFRRLTSASVSLTEHGVEDCSCAAVYAGRLLQRCTPELEAFEEVYPFESSKTPGDVSVDISSECREAAENLMTENCACSPNIRDGISLLGHPTSTTGYNGVFFVLYDACDLDAEVCYT